jgi:DNA-binding beta-propeller fold protein YncE
MRHRLLPESAVGGRLRARATLRYACPLIGLLALLAVNQPASGRPRPFAILAVEEMHSRVTIIDSADTSRRLSIAVGYKPHEIVVSQDGRLAFVSNFGLNDADNRAGVPGQTISVIDIRAARTLTQLRLPEPWKAPHGLAFRPRHPRSLYVNAEVGDRMVVFDVTSRKVSATFALPAGIHNFIFARDGATLFAFAPAGDVFRLDAATGTVLASMHSASPIRGLAWNFDQSALIAASRGELDMLDPVQLQIASRLPLRESEQAFYCEASPDGRLILAPSVQTGAVTVFATPSSAVVERISTGTPLRVVIGPDPDDAYVANVSPEGRSVTVIHLKSLTTEQIGGLQDVNGLAFSHDLPTSFGAP